MIAYNRPGVHNWVLICCAPAQVVDELLADQVTGGEVVPGAYSSAEIEFDQAYSDAVHQAIEADLDQYLEAIVEIGPEFDQVLKELAS